MSERPYDRKIHCLATLRDGQTACPFCGGAFIPDRQWCRFERYDSPRFASTSVLYCEKCDLHFSTEGEIAALDRRAGKIGLGKTAAFPVAHMSAETVRKRMYGTVSDTPKETGNAPDRGRRENTVAWKRISVPQGKKAPLSKYLYEPHDTELFAEYDVPASTLGIVGFNEAGRKEEEVFVLVDDPAEQDSLHGVFWSGREISELIIDALARHSREIQYRQFGYFINWYTGPKLRARIIARYEGYRKLKKLEENARELVDVQIYRGKRPCLDHPDATEILRVNIFGIRTPEAHPIFVYYCPVCSEYYVNYDEYLRFCRRYGVPPFRLYDDRSFFGTGDGYYENLKEQSELNLYGYNVNESSGLTTAERQSRLAEIIDAGLMKQAEVCSFIEGIMRLHRNNPNSIVAMRKWEQDLAFAQAYKQDESRVVWGKFVPGRRKKLLPPPGE